MFKLYREYKKLKSIRLKYEELQYFLSRILRSKNSQDLYKLELEVHRNKVINYGTRKKLARLITEKEQLLKKNR